jgi:hypothetical protein
MFVRLLATLITNILYSFLVFSVVQVIATNMASKGQKYGLKVKILPWCVRPHLVRSNVPTHAAASRSHAAHHGRTQPAAGPSGYLRSNAGALRSNARMTQP